MSALGMEGRRGELDKIALISDIHGNVPALQAALHDIARRGIQRVFCLGDLVGKGPHSERVVDICQAVCERTIKGNWDDALATTKTDNPTIQWHQRRLGRTRLEFLKDLLNTIEFVMSGKQIRLFHASQKSVHYRVRQPDPIEKLQAMFDNTDFTDTRLPRTSSAMGISMRFMSGVLSARRCSTSGASGILTTCPRPRTASWKVPTEARRRTVSRSTWFAFRTTSSSRYDKPRTRRCRALNRTRMNSARLSTGDLPNTPKSGKR